jgi:dTDP-4-amino-4,6-dideoxygalactose transaminase
VNTIQIPFNRAFISDSDIGYFINSTDGGHISGNGRFTKRAETLLEESLGVKRTLLTTSCTHALEMSALLARVGPGDEVIVPSFTFVSSASAFMLFGATPVFVDVKSSSLNIDPKLVERAITPRTKAICLVHYGGIASGLDDLLAIAAIHNLLIIEDNAHGLFSTFKGKKLGSFGNLATQSFHETKNITCGEGGALVINDEDLVERSEILREKGTDRTKFLRGQVDKYTWVDVGSSWVMSDMLAAILCGQLERADIINAQRIAIYNRYDNELHQWADKHGVLTPYHPSESTHTAHVYHLRFRVGEMRDRFISHLAEHQIAAVFHYQPLHLSKIGRRLGGIAGDCPVSEHAGDCLVRLPLFNTLTINDQTRVIETIQSFNP